MLKIESIRCFCGEYYRFVEWLFERERKENQEFTDTFYHRNIHFDNVSHTHSLARIHLSRMRCNEGLNTLKKKYNKKSKNETKFYITILYTIPTKLVKLQIKSKGKSKWKKNIHTHIQRSCYGMMMRVSLLIEIWNRVESNSSDWSTGWLTTFSSNKSQ